MVQETQIVFPSMTRDNVSEVADGVSVMPLSILPNILVGDVRKTLAQLPDKSVHCVVTSPPYWGLRDYLTANWIGGDPACSHKRDSKMSESCTTGQKALEGAIGDGIYKVNCLRCGAIREDCQLGLEPTYEEYVNDMVEVFSEIKRVLRDDGTLWLNLGDSYAGSNGNGYKQSIASTNASNAGGENEDFRQRIGRDDGALKPKDLVGIPWRVAFALQADGWWLRQDIIWCLSGGAWVYARTQKGDMPIMVREIARLKPNTVQLWNGSQWTHVLGISKSRRRGNELEIVLRSGERISCTPAHQFPTQRGLLTASEIRQGDILNNCRLPEPSNPKDCAIDEDAAWFAGLYIAEGSRSDDTIQIAGHAKETARWERLQAVAKKFGGTTTRTVKGNCMDIRLHGKVLNAIIDELVSGRVAKNKGFAPVVWRYSDAFVASMLQGYLDGDGHYDKPNNRWRLGFTRNYNLERDIRVACARLGYHLTLKPSSVKYRGTKRPTFHGEIRMTRSGHRNECSPYEVMAINKARCRYVYDIGVADEPHLFALASGVLTHNSKPNPMPESVTDRCTKAHEYIFLLTKKSHYFFDSEAIKEPAQYAGDDRGSRKDSRTELDNGSIDPNVMKGATGTTRNKRSVWTINTKPFKGAHFATFPEALIEPCILSGTSVKGCCGSCGSPIKRMLEKTRLARNELSTTDPRYRPNTYSGAYGEINGKGDAGYTISETIGWARTCECKTDETVPCVVLDPFFGAGTTGVVAEKLGRDFRGCELNPEYAVMATERIENERRLRLKEIADRHPTLF